MSRDTRHSGLWALLLRKAPGRAKSRLSGVLSDNERKMQAEKMFRHVLHQVLGNAGITRVAVISPERPALPEGVVWIADGSGELNGAVSLGIDAAVREGADRVLILPCDLPWLHGDDLRALVAAGDDYDMVIAPDEADDGTNALLLRTPGDFTPAFGSDSFARHLAAGRETGRTVAVVKRPGLAFDLDDEDDWHRYCANNQSLDCHSS